MDKKYKVNIKLLGGIGNNLFQIACAYAYSLKHNCELVLFKEKFGATHGSFDSYSSNVLRNINFSDPNTIKQLSQYQEPFFNYQEIPGFNVDLQLNGYFQTELYFKEYSQEILDLFSYPDNFIESIKKEYSDLLNLNACSMHVRRGDYVHQPENHPTQSMNYYMKAIKQMPSDSIFLIFSDDIEWCKQNFPDLPEKFYFIEGNKDFEDLFLMTQCKNNIICNSSFSWWGAWLNKNQDKKIIAPLYTRWVGQALSNLDTKDVIPKNWIQL